MAAPVAAAGAAAAGKAAGGAGAAGTGAAKGVGAGGATKAGPGGRLGNRLGRQAAYEAGGRAGSKEEREKSLTRALVVLSVPILVIITILQVATLPLSGASGRLSGAFASAAGIPAAFLPAYGAAADHYEVNPFLLAAIHKQESDFGRSTLAGVSARWNGCGAAGPMQMGIVGVAPYFASVFRCPNPNGAGATWNAHKHAFRPISAVRGAMGSYPLHRDELRACRRVSENVGCVYDSFDAIAGAAHKLRADGADKSLDSEGTRRAVCRYIGTCSEVDSCTGGPNQYCEVLPRAHQWEQLARSLAAEGSGGSGHFVSYGGRGELAWPTPPAYRRISSGFGMRWGRVHEGIDIPLPTGTPIAAAERGEVTHAGWHGGYGNLICIHRVFENEDERSTCYAHLSRILTRIGARVGRGEVIGLSGNTGQSTGPHLHFELRLGRYRSGQAVDPHPCLGGERACPVKPGSNRRPA